jgi:hypothetical protein
VAQRYDGGNNDEGKVYVYHGSASGLAALPSWTFETSQDTARPGTAGAAGDVNDDGFDDFIVGAALYDGAFPDQGRVWIFHGSMTGLSATAGLVLDGTAAGTNYGSGGISAGNVNGDDYGDVLISASGWSDGEESEGGAWLHLGSASGLTATPSWFFESDQVRAGLGPAAGTGDVNGDGFDDVVVPSQAYDATRLGEGKAWLFLGGGAGLAASPAWEELGWQIDAGFGADAGAAGNVDGDGYDDFFVGAGTWDDVGHNEGAVFVWHGAAGAPASVAPPPCDAPPSP